MNLICRIFGHRTQHVETGVYYRHGRPRMGFTHRCLRCHEEGYYPPGEPALIPDLDAWLCGLGRRLRRLWRSDCTYCQKPDRRFGLPVGNHEACDEIPF
jgi:hypothetical protein